MPFAENHDAKIYWVEEGTGEPVLLIMGLGYASCMWYRTRPILAEAYRVLTFDNRGVGQSDVPPGPYCISQMAGDAAAVLDAAGIGRAHLFGISMGGMIAQEFALQYPERVASLILGCTAAGGPNAVRAESAILATLAALANMPAEQAAETAVSFIYDPGTPRHRIDEDIATRRPWFPSRAGYLAQLHAIRPWESFRRLHQINLPTLVIHGKTDQLIPAGNAELIAGQIRGSHVALLERAGHLFLTDQTDAAHHAILEFLASCRAEQMQPAS
jgi:3-oxoadipate enol-lactonase